MTEQRNVVGPRPGEMPSGDSMIDIVKMHTELAIAIEMTKTALETLEEQEAAGIDVDASIEKLRKLLDEYKKEKQKMDDSYSDILREVSPE